MKLSDESILDLYEARNYYSHILNRLLKKFDSEIADVIKQLKGNSQHVQKRYRTIEIVFSNIFPFGIHYLVAGATISIQRILHQKREY